ncbi:peptide chain release factor aRF-1 [Candidatus Nitrososphaera sp. FF02]|uniref:peptide chain release factor aRF-1 n=1 Tax=Candidatus Nitrososphaera sp. FF02 TaxID=3398226 RepID=UPI0039E7E2A1
MGNDNGASKWDSVRRYKLTKMINELSSISGHGTELVTVYVPPRRPIFDVIAQLRNEAGTASNIKSDLTRNHVQDALSKTMEHLKLFKETPENGLVIFCGAIPTGKGFGTEKIELTAVIPPKPIQISLYRCDDHFWTDHLREMMKDEKVIGILAVDTSEAGIGILTGDRWETIDTLTSGVAGKHRQGGQSARRFERLRDNELNEYYHRVADHAKAVFIDQFNVKGLIVGGPGPTKDNFLKEEYLDYRLQNNILVVLDTSYSGDEGVREIIDKAQKDGILAEFRVMEEKQMVKKFMGEVHSNKGLGIYGIFDVVKALQAGMADMVLLTSEISYVKLDFKCKSCKNIQEKIVERAAMTATKQEISSKPCPSCGATDFEVAEKDIVDYFQELATMTGTRLEVISGQTEEGAQLGSLGKVGAILRYRPM